MTNQFTEHQEFLIGQLERKLDAELPRDCMSFDNLSSDIIMSNADYFNSIASSYDVKQMYHERNGLNFTLNLQNYLTQGTPHENETIPVWVFLKGDEVSKFYGQYGSNYRIPGHNEGI